MPVPAAKMTSVEKVVDIACDGLYGRHWYRDATAQIDFVALAEGWDRNEFAGVIATTSPRCAVVRNIRMSLHFMHHRDIRVVPMKGIRSSVNNFLDGKGIAGPKTRAFCDNLSGCTKSITLDVWMAYALNCNQTDFNRKASNAKAKSRVRAVATVLGIEPCEAQAAIWTGYRTRAGLNHTPFSIASEYFAARTNGWEIEGCSIHE